MRMKAKVLSVVLIFVMLAGLTGCESGAQRIANLAGKFKSGNHYGRYGQQLNLKNLSYEIGILANKKVKTTEIITFSERLGEGNGFYTGKKRKNGDIYTWSARRVPVYDYGDFIRAGALFAEPVYIDYENKTIPLTAAIDEYGNIVSDVGKGSDNPIYVMVDIVDRSDIWYCTGMASDIRNQYSKLSAYSVLVGKCAEARANANGLLLKDIARLTGAKLAVQEKDGLQTYSDADLAIMAATASKFDEKIKDKIRLSKQLNKAMNEAITYTTGQGAKLAGLIARDVAYMAALSAQAAAATASIVAAALGGKTDERAKESLAAATAQIVRYAIIQYGPTKEIQALGKKSDEIAKSNYAYGKLLMKDAKRKLDLQQKQLDAILSEMDFGTADGSYMAGTLKEVPAADYYRESESQSYYDSTETNQSESDGSYISTRPSKSDRSGASFIVNAGVGFGFVFSGLVMNYGGSDRRNCYLENNIEFGGTFVGNFAITFDAGRKKSSSVGFAMQLGYSGQAGPSLGVWNTVNGVKNHLSNRDWYGASSIGTARHAFFSDIDLMIRSAKREDSRFVFQAGVRVGALLPIVWWKYNGKFDYERANKPLFIVGPNIFLGGDGVGGDSFLAQYGLRVSAAFYGKKENGLTTFKAYLDFAFELKFNWQKHVM